MRAVQAVSRDGGSARSQSRSRSPGWSIRTKSARLTKDIAEKHEELADLGGKLANAKFWERAPAEVVAKQQSRQAELRDSLAKQQALLSRLS